MSSEQNNKLDYYTPDKMTIDEYNAEKSNNNRPLVLGDISNMFIPLLNGLIEYKSLLVENRNDLSKIIAKKLWGIETNENEDIQEGRVISNMDDVFLTFKIGGNYFWSEIFNTSWNYIDKQLLDIPAIDIKNTEDNFSLIEKGENLLWGINVFENSKILIPKIEARTLFKLKLTNINELNKKKGVGTIAPSFNTMIYHVSPDQRFWRCIWDVNDESLNVNATFYQCVEYDSKKLYSTHITMDLVLVDENNFIIDLDYLTTDVYGIYESNDNKKSSVIFSKTPLPNRSIRLTLSNIDEKPLFSEFEIILTEIPSTGRTRSYNSISLNIDNQSTIRFNNNKINNLNNDAFEIQDYYLVVYNGAVIYASYFIDNCLLINETEIKRALNNSYGTKYNIENCKFYVVCKEMQYNTYIGLPLDIEIGDYFFDGTEENTASVTIESIMKNDIIVGVYYDHNSFFYVHYLETRIDSNFITNGWQFVNHQDGSSNVGNYRGFPFFVGIDYYYRIKPNNIQSTTYTNLKMVCKNTENLSVNKEIEGLKGSKNDTDNKNVINLLFSGYIVGYNYVQIKY